MSKVITLADHLPPVPAQDLDPFHRVAAIVEHVERLAEGATYQRGFRPNSPQFVRHVIAARAARGQFFNSELFADPAWDILLDLYALSCEHRRTSVSALCTAARVPATTALRWIEKLQSDGLLIRTEDPLDARRVWVSISPGALTAMHSYLEKLSTGSMPL